MVTRDKRLDILKGSLIFMVIFGHLGGFWLFNPYSMLPRVFCLTAVPLMFVVSGFFFFAKERAVLQVLRRAAHLYGVYLLFILIQMLFNLIYNKGIEFDPQGILYILLVMPPPELFAIYPGHVWFLRAYLMIILTVIAFMSIRVFLLKTKILVLPRLTFFALFLIATISGIVVVLVRPEQLDHTFATFFYYLPIFLCGKYFGYIRKINNNIKIVLIFLLTILIVLIHFQLISEESFTKLITSLFVLLIYSLVEDRLANLKTGIDSFLIFCSRNIFEIYLFHHSAIFFVERHLIAFFPTKNFAVVGVMKLIFTTIITIILVLIFNTALGQLTKLKLSVRKERTMAI